MCVVSTKLKNNLDVTIIQVLLMIVFKHTLI